MVKATKIEASDEVLALEKSLKTMRLRFAKDHIEMYKDFASTSKMILFVTIAICLLFIAGAIQLAFEQEWLLMMVWILIAFMHGFLAKKSYKELQADLKGLKDSKAELVEAEKELARNA